MSTTDFTDFTVPRFIGFNMEPEDEEVETYFEYNHESNYLSISETNSSMSSETKWHPSEDVLYSESVDVIEEVVVEEKYKLRKSMSTGDLTALANLIIKNEPMSPMLEEPHSKLQKHRSLSRLNAKAIKEGQYVSVAEKMNKFWTDTPERFRSQPKLNGPSKKLGAKLGLTLPKTPNLSTKNRSRPVTILSREQLEEMEMEEARRHQIKAHPMNHRILQDPKFLPVDKRPVTKVRPFNLTEMHTKKIEGPMKATVPHFQANPVPQSVYERPKDLRQVPPRRVTPKRAASRETLLQDSSKPRPTRTEPKPFSFENRDKGLMRKREALVNKILEEERKAREFHARPLPKSVIEKARSTSSCSSRSNKSVDADPPKPIPFKATSPKVLRQKPFIPKKADRPLFEVTEFQLNTVMRAKEREEFEMKKKEKEETANRLRQENEMRLKQKELEEKARLRKEMEHKANPIRRFKQLPTIEPTKLTVAMSPKFLSGKRSNKENFEL